MIRWAGALLISDPVVNQALVRWRSYGSRGGENKTSNNAEVG